VIENLVFILLTNDTSSGDRARCGNNSLNHRSAFAPPDETCAANSEQLRILLDGGEPLASDDDSGITWPSSRRLRLRRDSQSWLGPPAMKRKNHSLGLAENVLVVEPSGLVREGLRHATEPMFPVPPKVFRPTATMPNRAIRG